MLLQVMALTRNIGINLQVIGQSYARDFSQGGIRLFRGCGKDPGTDPATLGTRLQGSGFTPVFDLVSPFSN